MTSELLVVLLVYFAASLDTYLFCNPLATAASVTSCVWQARSSAMKKAAASATVPPAVRMP